MIDFKPERNLVFCGNKDFVIKVDQLQNQKIRYRCWRRPKTILEIPDLILLNGKVRTFQPMDKLEYVFPIGGLTYVLERIKPKNNQKATYIFLEVTNEENEKFTWKLQELDLNNGLKELL